MVKLRSVFLQLLASVLALLIWSGPVWALEPEPELAPPQPEPELGPESAHFMPDTTSLMVSLTGSPLKMAGNESAGASSQLTDLPAALLATGGIDYQKDIRPWVSDEITFALTSLENGQPGYLLAVKTRNNRDADAFLERIWQQQATDGQTINFERYAGVDLISADVSPNVATPVRLPGLLKPVRYLTTAKLDDRFILIANQRQVIEQAVDSSKKKTPQLAKRSEYKTAIASLTQKQKSGMAYLDLEKLLPAISGQAATTPPTYRSLGIAFGESRQGLLAETALVAKAGRDLPAVKITQQEPMAALSYFPGNSPFVVSGSNLGTLWSQINQDLQGYPNLKSWVNQTLGTWGKTRGLNLTSKIFPWVDGDYAWALLPDSLSPVLSAQANAEADWLFAYEQTNSDKNKQLATHLNELATEQDLGTSPFELAGRKVYAWTRLVSQEIDDTRSSNLTFKTEVTGAYANIDNQKILASSPEALGLALDAGSDALTSQRSFQDAIAPFDQPNQGFLYIDWPVMKPILKKNLPVISKLESNAQTLLSKLRSVSVSSYGETPEVQHSQWYFRF
ncbi:DUF3352 domain-containing protein [Acaryochloris sp. CCMEE 5410]|uniref:DUF3352 domain-containing protein n=1 Tax=Acaryochloris sp. CCMEE 5410 TaxID=310037 RepID=UPI0002484906|nr:DUF3352 domain-containing protein [Acaryochloris sp. CCMEE 5410]KAI9130452.1 DUF3352 domain-containing protein [Acaryochloris sp. CCMEE 5410]